MADQLADDRTASGETAFVDLRRRVIHAEDRLAEIKSELRELNGSVKELNATILGMGKPHFQTWAAIGTLVASVTAGAWWLAIAPISDRVKAIEVMDTNFVSRELHIEKWAEESKELQRLEDEIAGRVTKDDLNRLIIDIDRRLSKSRER